MYVSAPDWTSRYELSMKIKVNRTIVKSMHAFYQASILLLAAFKDTNEHDSMHHREMSVLGPKLNSSYIMCCSVQPP